MVQCRRGVFSRRTHAQNRDSKRRVLALVRVVRDHDVCAKYEAEFDCLLGLTQEQCEADLESCDDKDRRLIDDAYGCMAEVGLLECGTTTMTTTEQFDALQECGEELGAYIENVSNECAGLEGGLTT